MKTSDDAVRQYLLGEADEDTREALERSYFDDPHELQRLDAADEALIEAYLGGELDPATKQQFERTHLSHPDGRRRVETIRRLTQAAAGTALADRTASGWPRRHTALAASLLVAVMAGWWLLSSARRVQPPPGNRISSVPQPPAATEPPRAATAPVVLALTVFPVSTRSAGETAVAKLDAHIDTLKLELQTDQGQRPLENAHAVIQTVEGREVWRGAAEISLQRQNAFLARVSIPAARLAADDYVVILLDAGRGAGDEERYRYFFRVRRP